MRLYRAKKSFHCTAIDGDDEPQKMFVHKDTVIACDDVEPHPDFYELIFEFERPTVAGQIEGQDER